MTKSFYQFWTSAIILSLFVSFANSSESSGTNAAIVSPDGDIRSVSASSGKEHGVDVSWPMQHDPSNIIKSDGSHQHFFAYERYMSGCTKQADTCHYSEKDRIEMNLLQPSAMQNYTHAGYAKVPTPQVVQDMLTSVWKDHHQEQTRELWDRGNTYVNHWESPTYMVDWETHLSKSQKQNLVKQLQSVLEAWTQQSLVVTSVYGIRVYKEGSILAPHVDRLPLVSSAIINVAQDVQEPWMLQVIGHDGKARNITMKPGEMILYESHSIIHGRPFRLNGNYYANAFVHFEPLGHTLRHSQAGAYGATDDVSLSENAKKAYENALLKEQMKKVKTAPVAVQGKFQNNDKPPSGSPTLPLYVPEENQVEWNQQFDFEKEEKVRLKGTNARSHVGTLLLLHETKET